MPSRETPHPVAHRRFSRSRQVLLLLLVWTAIYAASTVSPPLLDDADSTHAQAAQAMLRTGDWVTLHVNGIRYLEKAPLPYWIAALSLRLFGNNSFAIHLPLALTVLALAALAWAWGNYAFSTSPTDSLAGFYAALLLLTSTGVFLFTRVFIPDALLSLLLAFTLYAAQRALERPGLTWSAAAWIALALAVLAKGLVAIVFFFGAMALYLPLSGELRHWKRLQPALGSALFLAIAAPWHVLAALRNGGSRTGHGFLWFYFVNEHVLRFLGRRTPVDYNKLPATLFWSLHLLWLFPWSFFAPALLVLGWRNRSRWWPPRRLQHTARAPRTALLLLCFSALVLVFFSLSTNQEYYTFPVYLPLLLLLACALTHLEAADRAITPRSPDHRLLLCCHACLVAFGLAIAAALAYGLWSSRDLPRTRDIGEMLAHRGVGQYTLSLSHFFDLTTASFSCLRLPATLACIAFAIGPALSLFLRAHRRHIAATLTVAFTSTVFLLAAHLALVRFAPLLSSQTFALKIQQLEQTGAVEPHTQVLLYGDQALGSSIPFYLGHSVFLVDGRSTSMLFGSTFPDAPPLFLTPRQLQASWGKGQQKLLFVPLEHRADADRLLGAQDLILLYESSGKALFTDRPLTPPAARKLDSHSPLSRQ